MTKQQFKELSDKYLNGSATQQEEQILFDWYDTIQKKSVNEKPLSFKEESVLFGQLRPKLKNRVANLNRFFWSKIAAILVLAVFAAFYGRQFFKPDEPDATEKLIHIATGNAQKYTKILPDGTLIWLNAKSKLDYPAKFTASNREVWLSGEAYFEVKHDVKRPFIVHTTNLDVKVLGTVFNLKAYPTEKTEALLLKGSVEVTLNTTPVVNQGSKKKVILKPGQKLIVKKTGLSLSEPEKPVYQIVAAVAHQQEPVPEIAWAQQVFTFRNERLETIVPVLEKWFGVKISIKNPEVKGYRFTGTFSDSSLSGILDAFQFSNRFEYRKEGDQEVIIY